MESNLFLSARIIIKCCPTMLVPIINMLFIVNQLLILMCYIYGQEFLLHLELAIDKY
jgi:hypothetical protein